MDGFTTSDLKSANRVDMQLNEIRARLETFFEQEGEVEASFAKCKLSKILIYATFKHP